jgi:hypothetical protein
MPRIATNAVAGIAQWLVFQPVRVEPYAQAVRDEEVAVAGDEVRHRVTPPDVAVQPKTAGHGMHHPITPLLELEPADGATGRKVAY